GLAVGLLLQILGDVRTVTRDVGTMRPDLRRVEGNQLVLRIEPARRVVAGLLRAAGLAGSRRERDHEHGHGRKDHRDATPSLAPQSARAGLPSAAAGAPERAGADLSACAFL